MRALPLLAAGVAALAALTGCATTTVTTPASTAVAAPVKAVAVAAATPAPPTSKAPALATTGTTWPTVVGSLITYGQWLLANPNPTLTGNITVPGCAADNALQAELRSYVAQRAYVQPAAPELTSISGPTGTIGGQVQVDIEAVRGSETVYQRTRAGSTTHVVSGRAGLTPTGFSLTLIRGTDSHWRFCTVTVPADSADTDALTTLL